MSKFNKKKLNAIYKDPLPVDIIYSPDGGRKVQLPQLIPHNPVSWLFFTIGYIKAYTESTKKAVKNAVKVSATYDIEAQRARHQITVVLTDHGVFKVDIQIRNKNSDALKLWKCGFFGKGILSRSEPTWYERTERRLHLVENYTEKDLTSEEITTLRRDERKKFKQLRESYERKELDLEHKLSALIDRQRAAKSKADKDDIENELWMLQKQLRELKNLSLGNLNFRQFRVNNNISLYEKVKLRAEDEQIIIKANGINEQDKEKLMQLEYLQLMPIETFFLKFALNDTVKVIEESTGVSLNTFELFKRCVAVSQNNFGDAGNIEDTEILSNLQGNERFLLHYVVYHHYRSLRWCVRSGIKFGVDYLLYEKGPPLSHAKYCLHIIENSKKTTADEVVKNLDFVQFSSLNRVIGGVRKTLVFVYVDTPKVEDFQSIMNELVEAKDKGKGCVDDVLRKLLGLYKITEIVYRRWIPSRNRD